ncbi:ATPase, T2SS/T4P/T4SS family [Variovorax sp. ZS18.2.2]|uniref:GspE/PulE family protein n=1 Tax=Variovorax sp. ZS18.2.2 TaxID=2971255 RepID=UPI0021513639|nr:ATPase, T2SS/T4P/T4SS family [Variovorax sp. ZS18.2.2]MCR6481016.1 ATPase, T2SS/T4P/T4SS family [Variovorax sp. ZS18.2.2]
MQLRESRGPGEPSDAARAIAKGKADEAPGSYRTYADVPKFLGVMTLGERPVVQLVKADHDQVVVIELAGRSAVIVHAGAQQALLESIKGTLRGKAYTVALRSAPASVIKEIHVAGGKATSVPAAARHLSPYMQAADEWIRYAVDNRASDIHLETHGSNGEVRFRIDGEVEPMRTANGGHYPANFILECMASLYNNDQEKKSGSDSLFDAEKNLYCMVPYKEIPGHSLKLRFQSTKGNEGPKAVLRILPVGDDQPTRTFVELGFAPSQIALLESAMETPSGLICVAGVTNSGKTTMFKSFIELNPATPTSNVMTIEDPVEYPIRGAHQYPIQRDLSNPQESAKRFSEVISAYMRMDPDVVMVGEIRDRHSANAARQIAQSGHMGLGTVHAHLLSGIVPRLVDPEIGMTRSVLTAPNMLTLLVYQALVPLLCPHCAMTSVEVEKDRRVTQIMANVRTLGQSAGALRWKRPGGCPACQGRGTLGRTVVAEMLMPDEDWLKHIREERDTEAMEVYRASRTSRDLMDPDMTGKTIFEHTLHKALHGLVDARNCSAFDTWPRVMSRHEVNVRRLGT